MGDQAKVKLGLKNVHYYPVTVGGEAGARTLTFGEGKEWPGAVSMSIDVSADSTKSYGDDTVYYISNAIPTEELELESYMIPEDFLVSYLGAKKDDDGNIVDGDDDVSTPFAFAFEFSTDKRATRYLYFYCTAAKPSDEAETKSDKAEPKTIKLKLTAAGVDGFGRRKVSSAATTESAYNTWYSTPKAPTFTGTTSTSSSN